MSRPPEGVAGRIGERLRRHRAVEVEVLDAEVAAPPALVYAGLVTRAVAFALDAAIINAVAAITGVIVALGISILHLPHQANAAIAAVLAGLWVIWTVVYFTFFWSTTGQTPGSRALGIRVIDPDGDRDPIRPVRAAARFGALILGAIPLLAGFLIMLWDDRGRALQDRVTGTVVIDTPPDTEATAAEVEPVPTSHKAPARARLR